VDRILVTIDGPAGSGKTTLAKMLSREMNVPYLDTGAMFRTVALALGEGAWLWDEEEIARRLGEIGFEVQLRHNGFVMVVEGKVVGDEIRDERIGKWASNIATIGVVRDFLKERQQEVGRRFSLVAEGRDMGTVIFPWADFKFFLEADVYVRAKRRHRELLERGIDVSFSRLLEEIEERDAQDRSRDIAPLRPAEDAIIIDTSELSPHQVLQRMLSVIKKR